MPLQPGVYRIEAWRAEGWGSTLVAIDHTQDAFLQSDGGGQKWTLANLGDANVYHGGDGGVGFNRWFWHDGQFAPGAPASNQIQTPCSASVYKLQ
ncbi:MAG: hypothetical protein LBL52_01670 [Rickettsiales bacterium]|nr:hypothetical protein [Rickettsiales bacterium]